LAAFFYGVLRNRTAGDWAGKVEHIELILRFKSQTGVSELEFCAGVNSGIITAESSRAASGMERGQPGPPCVPHCVVMT